MASELRGQNDDVAALREHFSDTLLRGWEGEREVATRRETCVGVSPPLRTGELSAVEVEQQPEACQLHEQTALAECSMGVPSVPG